MATVRHRVVVQLKDVSMDDEPSVGAYYYDASNTPLETVVAQEFAQRNAQTTDAEAVDNRTLVLTKTSATDDKARPRCIRQLHFDCVGSAADIQTRAEYGSMLDLLILKHYNCCLVQFSGQRCCQVPFLCNLLVTEIDRRLQKLRAYMHSVRVEFYDVRKFDVINLFGSAGKSQRPLRPRSRNHFNNTLELLKWLQSDYAHMWSVGRGHNILELHFKYSDGRRRMHTTKFSVVDIHTGQMDTESKASLRNFLENCTGEKRLRQTNTLIDCLREYFLGPELWRTWLVFDVPTSCCRNAVTEDLLKLANAAYAGSLTASATEGIKEYGLNMDGDLSASNSLMDSRLATTAAQLGAASAVNVAAGSRQQLRNTKRSKSHTHVLMPPSAARRTTVMTTATTAAPLTGGHARGMKAAASKDSRAHIKQRVEDFSTKDLDSLSSWYCKVDEKFALVIAAMECYYERKYDTKIVKIGSDIQQLVRTEDHPVGDMVSTISFKDLDDVPSDTKLPCRPEMLQAHHEQYRQSVAAFRLLARDVAGSKYSQLLQVYLKTKNYELTQHALRFKMRQLENCRTQLTDIIKREIGVLNNLRQKAASRPPGQRQASKLAVV